MLRFSYMLLLSCLVLACENRQGESPTQDFIVMDDYPNLHRVVKQLHESGVAKNQYTFIGKDGDTFHQEMWEQGFWQPDSQVYQVISLNNVYVSENGRKEYSLSSYRLSPRVNVGFSPGFDIELYQENGALSGSTNETTRITNTLHQELKITDQVFNLYVLKVYDKSHGPIAHEPSFTRYWTPQLGTVILQGRSGILQLKERKGASPLIIEKLIEYIQTSGI